MVRRLAALSQREQPGQHPLDTLVAYLQTKRLLLVLDNCEHMVEACATLATRLLATCPELSILATSQMPLGSADETIRRVATLAVPAPVAGTLAPEALHRLALHRELGDREGIGNALLGLGDVARDLGDTVRVREYCEETLALFRELGHTWVGFSLNNLALAAYLDGDLESAAQRAEESAALFRDLQAGPSLAEVLVTLGHIRGAQGELATAHAYLSEALTLASAQGPRFVVAAALDALGMLAVGQEQTQHGVQLLGTAPLLRQVMGTPMQPADRPAIETALSAARAVLGATAFEDAWAAGQVQSIEHIVTQSGRRIMRPWTAQTSPQHGEMGDTVRS